MGDVSVAFVLTAASSLVPLYLGISLPAAFKLRSLQSRLILVGLAAGILFWFFLDVMNDASLLDVNQGFTGDYSHVVLALSFGLCLALLFGLERLSKSRMEVTAENNSSAIAGLSFGVAAIAALGIGFHAFGEGMDIGSIVPTSTSIIGTLGGIAPGFAYVLHKLLEGFVVGVFAVLAGKKGAKQLGLLGLIAGIPTLVGFPIGVTHVLEATYFFALGGAGAVYAELKLIPRLANGKLNYETIFAMLLGFYLMYFAGLFHG